MFRTCLRGLSVALCVTSISLVAVNARAQDQIKPRVLFIFDTSGSMIWPVCFNSYNAIEGDNSLECPGDDVPCTGSGSCNTSGCGDGVGNDSRLFKVKGGTTSVVSAFGEVEFAQSSPWHVSANHASILIAPLTAATPMRVAGLGTPASTSPVEAGAPMPWARGETKRTCSFPLAAGTTPASSPG
ncbi:MAG: hypothetical protein JRH20_27950 [Deltaproteobacteria bacterium]|nr:hypothetical protein [Deltaproteobacteria bacterium]